MLLRFVDRFALDSSDVRKTSDGYVVATPRVARVGIQLYGGKEVGRPDLSVVRVYRSDAEVFKKDSLATFAFRPITDDHPSVPVDASNWKDHAAGLVGGEVARDGEFIRVPMTLMDAKAISKFEAGKAELSVGYMCDLDFTAGTTPDGLAYDAQQKDIRVNHIALVKDARGGRKLRIGDNAALMLNDGEMTSLVDWYVDAFNPNQPRDPAGSDTGGQWTGGSGGGSARIKEQEKIIEREFKKLPQFAESNVEATIKEEEIEVRVDGDTYTMSAGSDDDEFVFESDTANAIRIPFPDDFNPIEEPGDTLKSLNTGLSSLEAKMENEDLSEQDWKKLDKERQTLASKRHSLLAAHRAAGSKRRGPKTVKGLKPSDSQRKDENMKIRDMVIDGVSCSMDEQTAQIVQRALDTAHKALADANVKLDAFKKKEEEDEEEKKKEKEEWKEKFAKKDAECVALTTKLADAEAKLKPEAIDAMVADRVTVIGKAKVILGDKAPKNIDTMDTDAVRKAVVDHRLGDKAKDYTADHVKIAFDTLSSDVKAPASGSGVFDLARGLTDTAQVTDSETRQRAYDKRIADGWKNPVVRA